MDGAVVSGREPLILGAIAQALRTKATWLEAGHGSRVKAMEAVSGERERVSDAGVYYHTGDSKPLIEFRAVVL
jgi:hypothetical protein